MAPRMTPQTLLVVEEFLRTPTDRYGLEIARATGLPTGTVYPILDRLADGGLLDVRRETTNADNDRRPPRRMFAINSAGRVWAADLGPEVRQRVAGWFPNVAPLGPA